MDPTANSRCIFCTKIGSSPNCKVEFSEGNWKLEDELTADFIVENLLNLDTRLWKERYYGLDCPQPLTLSLCDYCDYRVRQCFSWHQQITRSTVLLESGRIALHRQIALSGLLSGDTTPNQGRANNSTPIHDLVFCNDDMDDIPSSLYTDFSTADGVNTPALENQININNSPRYGNENDSLVTFASSFSRNRFQLSSSYYDDVSSDSMDFSPEHRTPSQKIPLISSPPVLTSLLFSPIANPSQNNAYSNLSSFSQFSQNASTFSFNADSNNQLLEDDDIQILPTPPKPLPILITIDDQIIEPGSTILSPSETSSSSLSSERSPLPSREHTTLCSSSQLSHTPSPSYPSTSDTKMEIESKYDDEVEILPTPPKPIPILITIDSDDEINEATLPSTSSQTGMDWHKIKKSTLDRNEMAFFYSWAQDQDWNLSVYKCAKCCAVYEHYKSSDNNLRRRRGTRESTKCDVCKWNFWNLTDFQNIKNITMISTNELVKFGTAFSGNSH